MVHQHYKPSNKIEDKRVEVIVKCKYSCSDYKVSEIEWCECMYTCLNKSEVNWKLNECESDSTQKSN